MAIPEYNYIPTYIKRTIDNKPKDVVTASYWNELFNLLITQGDHTAEELGNILNHFTTVITDTGSELVAAIAEEHEYASAFEIHLFTSTDPVTADKTFAEIRQAIVGGREILLWVSDIQCLKPACKVYENSLTLTVFYYLVGDHGLRADLYECFNDNTWSIERNIKLASQDDVGDLTNLTTAHKSNLVAAINEVKQSADGKYVKPTDGIPKTDLAAAVQTSLGKADTALQAHQSLTAYRTAAAQDLIDNTKQDKLIAGENITIAADGKTISATGGGGSVPKPLTYDYMPEGYPTKSIQATTLMEEQEVAFALKNGLYAASITNAFEIAVDRTYTINWDGTEYECVAFVFAGEGIALGNLSIIGMGDDTGEPFLYGYNAVDFVGIYYTLDTSATHTISVKWRKEVITPMAYDFMPLGYPSKSGQNRTLMEEQELEFVLRGDGTYRAVSPNPLAIVEGRIYAINWDGIEYKCVCSAIDSTPVLGNLSIKGWGEDTGEPFIYVCYIDEADTAFYTLDTSATHTISVKEVETAIPMAEEFIPKMNVSAFTNDAGYLTLATLPKYGGESV